MEISPNTPKHDITVKGVSLSVPKPYTEGHQLKANEASVLNQTFAENLRNNFASSVADAIEKAGGVEKLDMSALQADFDKYITGYEFGVRRAGGGAGAPKLEPRVKIARDIAREKVKEAIRGHGLKVSDYSAEKINTLALALVQKDPNFLAEADRRIKSQQKAAAAAIDLGDLGEPDAKKDDAAKAA